MDVKTTFLNGELEEANFMRQPEGFVKERKEHIVCKLDKIIYGLKQASRRWYLKFHQTALKFKETELEKVPLVKGDLKKEHCPKNKEEEDEMRNKPYASLVGSIMYAQRTKAYMLIYICIENLELVGHANVNLGKAEDDYISTSCFLFKMARAFVAWKSAKQSDVLSSTMFSKYIACYEATSHAVWLRNFIKDIKVVDSISRLVQIYNYNTTTVFHSTNNKMSSGLQHIDRKYLIVREKVAYKLVNLIISKLKI
ncbi:unnamed protein product [Prunus armeniaca]